MKTGNTQIPSSRQPAKSPRASQRAHRWLAGGILAVLALAVIAGALLHAPTPAEAQSAVLISNTGQTADSGGQALNSTTAKRAQAFTLLAGASADGYTVTSIGIAFHTIGDTSTIGADLTVTLNASSSGSPGNVLCTLSNPSTFAASGVHAFDAPTTGTTCPLLTQNKTYFAVIERANNNADAISLNTTGSADEDSGGATGWSIANNRHWYTTAWDNTSGESHQIEITGHEGPPNNSATGTPFVRDAANPADTLLTVRSGMTLTVDTTGIMDDDGITMVNWMYQWAYFDGTNTTDITGATANTYLLEDKDIDNAMVVKVRFTDDLSNPEGPLQSGPSRFVGPKNLIVSNTGKDTAFDTNISLTATTPKLAQGFVAASAADRFTLGFIELTFGNITNTGTVGTGITVTLNADSSGSPGATLCTLENPATFATSGAHKFYAPTARISTLCPLLEASSTYHVVIEKNSSYTGGVSITHYLFKGTNRESAHDWSIPNEAQYYTSSSWADNATEFPMLIDVRARLTEFELEALTETEVPLTWSLLPSTLTGANKFRLLFLTDPEKPTSDDIDVYNEFVQAQANQGLTAIQDYATQFRVLGSTADDDARDNTETTYTATDPGVPIFWLNSGKVADDYQDLYDGSWDIQAYGYDRSGNFLLARVWTGSDTDGTEYFDAGISNAFGATSVRQGRLRTTSPNPLSLTSAAPTTSYRFYALSGVFTVANQPATGNVAISYADTGPPRVNDILTADTSGISDPNGTSRAVFTYQWIRYDGTTDTDIAGATDPAYKLTEEDLDQFIKVRVSMTDNHGFDEGERTSTSTAAVIPQFLRVRNLQSPGFAGALISTIPKAGQAFTTGSDIAG